MKKRLVLLLCALVGVLAVSAQTTSEVDLSDIDNQRIANAIQMMDNGRADKAIEILKELDKAYPDNYDILYELCYAYTVNQQFDEVLKLCKRLIKHPKANFQVYQMMGNTLDYMGKRKDAIKTYQDGLKKYPNAGLLYVEQAIISEQEEDYDKAVQLYEKALEVEPTLASSYFHLAKLFSMSTEPVWAIVYGEAACLLNVGDQRREMLGQLIYGLYQQNISISDNGNSIHTTMTKENTIDISPDSSIVRIPLPIAYEMSLLKSLATNKGPIDLPNLINIRQGLIEHLYKDFNGYYDVSILDYQRRILENGHWEAYNMWLMEDADPESFIKWTREDSAKDKMEAFAEWYDENPFEPTQTSPTLRTKVFLTENLNLPPMETLATAEGCRQCSADALRLAKWLFEHPADTTNHTRKQIQQFLIIWATNSDNVSIEIRPSAVLGTVEGTVYSIYALIEYALDNNVKYPGEEGYCYAVKRVLDYLDKNRTYLQLNDTIERYLQMSPEELDRQLHDDYNRPAN